MSNCTQQSAGC